jgi:ParB family chromosome partitioning protein
LHDWQGLTLGRDGAPVLQPQYYADTDVVLGDDGSAITVVTSDGSSKSSRAAMSQRLVDELAMQRRDVLALHVASDPGLALDLLVFALADADTTRFGPTPGLTVRGAAATGPAHGFVAHDAAATASLAELRSGLDESWRAGDTVTDRFDLFRSLNEAARAAWLGWVVGRTLEASLNMQGGRSNVFHDHLGRLMGIDMAAWWRPTAANFFDRVSKTVILDALADVGGTTLSSRFTASKKGDLAASAERIFSGNFITEVEVKDRALGWLPAAMTFAATPAERSDEITEECGDEDEADACTAIWLLSAAFSAETASIAACPSTRMAWFSAFSAANCASTSSSGACASFSAFCSRVIRLPEVIARVGIKRSMIYRLIGEGQFPRSRSLGPKCAVWVESEIDDWINAVAGAIL